MTWTETDHMLHALGGLIGLALAALMLVVILAVGAVLTIRDSLRARRRLREAHRRADVWLDPRSRPLAHRKARP